MEFHLEQCDEGRVSQKQMIGCSDGLEDGGELDFRLTAPLGGSVSQREKLPSERKRGREAKGEEAKWSNKRIDTHTGTSGSSEGHESQLGHQQGNA